MMTYKMKISGKNFQSWSDFTLDLEGLTVIVGPSNIGKSAIYRALKGVLRNEIPEYYIRNSQDEPLEIELEVDGHIIKASRKNKGSTKYVMDGKDFTSLGGKIPEEISLLGFDEIKVGEYSIDPIFSSQNKAQFLIDSDRWKPQELNSILGSFSNTEKLDAGKKEANLRIGQKKSEASTLASEVRLAEERRLALLDLNEKVASIKDEIDQLEKSIRHRESVIGLIQSSLHHYLKLHPLKKLIQEIPVIELSEVIGTSNISGLYTSTYNALTILKSLKEIEKIFKESNTSWEDALYEYKIHKAISELINQFSNKIDVHQYDEVLNSYILQVQLNLSEVKDLNDSILHIESSLKGRLAYQNLLDELKMNEDELVNSQKEVKKLIDESKIGKCPNCGKEIEHKC